jgi:uncharacterized protein YkwD
MLAAFSLAHGCASAIQLPAPVTQPPTSAPSGTRDYVRIEAEVLAALNRARTNPQGEAGDIERLLPYYAGRLFQRPGQVAVQTNEGIDPAREAITALRVQAPVGALALNATLTRAARDHAADQARTGATGHTGSDNSSVTTRVARYGEWQISISENIDYSPMVAGRDVIENLIIDDGVANRGHRRNIYDPSAKVVGIACGPHPRFGAMCVIVQAGGAAAR